MLGELMSAIIPDKRKSQSGGSILLFLAISMSLFATSALVLAMAQGRVNKARAYRLESVALAAAEAGLARAVIGLEQPNPHYLGEIFSLGTGVTVKVRVEKRNDLFPRYSVVSRGEISLDNGKKTTRIIRAEFETWSGQTVLMKAYRLPRGTK